MIGVCGGSGGIIGDDGAVECEVCRTGGSTPPEDDAELDAAANTWTAADACGVDAGDGPIA